MDEKHLSILSEIINLFVQKERRSRFVELLSNPRRYDDGLAQMLRDPRYFDERVISEIPSSQHTIDLIYEHLRKTVFGNKCFLIK